MKKTKGLTYKHFYLGTALALFSLLTVILYGYKSLDDSRTSSSWVTHTREVITKIYELQSHVNQLGTAQRGYIITTQERHLLNYEQTVPEITNDLKLVQSLTRDNSQQRELTRKLEEKLIELKRFYDANIDLTKKGNVQKAIENVKAGEGESLITDIRLTLQVMIAHEDDLLSKRLKEEKSLSETSNILILISAIFAFFLVLSAAVLIIREFKRRTKVQEDLNRLIAVQTAILDSAAFALIAVDLGGRITLFNPAAEKLLGYTANEVLGKDPSLFHVKDDIEEMAHKLSERFSENIPVGFETFIYRAKRGIVEADQWTYVAKDGKLIPVSLSVTAQKSLTGEIIGYLGIAIDITQQLEYEKTIIEAKEQALAGTQAKSEFLANMSHEIRTPMNAIMGMAELLNETDLNEEQKKYVEVFTRAGESLLSIINDILDLSKIEAGHFELHHTPFSLYGVVEKASEIMALKAHQKQIELAVDMDDDIGDFFIGDGNRIRQILLNLIGNAIKFTKKGEVLLKMSRGTVSADKVELIIEVTDTGIGMTQEQLTSLFERFNQLDSSITKEYGGTGLGLNITKRLVELMDGKISVQSAFGKGSKFTVIIFLEIDKSVRKIEQTISLTKKRILVVDDTKTNRLILKKILDHQGAHIEEAVDGVKGLQMIEEANHRGTPYDLVLLDCRMPGMDGFELAQKVQSSKLPGPLILMLTSDNRPGDLAKSKSLGLMSYLLKPVLKNELLMEISKALSQSMTRKQEAPLQEEAKMADNLRVLLVDDNDENRLVIRSFLKKLPWIVDEARNGQEALDLFEHGKYNVVLMDMQMPVVDGYTATKEIRRIEKENNAPEVPILALTAYALKEEVEKSLTVGCTGHLSKPVSKPELIAALESFSKNYSVKVDKDLEDLIPDYFSNRHKELIELNRALAESNFPLIQALGHKLRGSAGSYGFADLSVIGKELEEKSKLNDAASIKHALTQYGQYLSQVKITYE